MKPIDESAFLPIDHLPIEIRSIIFSNLAPEQVASIIRINKKIYKMFNGNDPKDKEFKNLFWKNKVEKHFPHLYRKIEQTKDIDWHKKFWESYNSEYDSLKPAIRKLFSLVKEHDLASLKQKLKIKDLDEWDKNRVTLLEWIQQENMQALLDHIYELKCKQYDENSRHIIKMNTDSKSRTRLHWAILCRQPIDEINFLIDLSRLQSGSLYNKIANGTNALHLAAIDGRKDIVEALIEKRPYLLDTRSKAGATALMFAVENNHLDVIQALINQGADISISLEKKTKYHDRFNVREGDNPFFAAIRQGHTEIIRILLESGADVHMRTGSISPIHLAAAYSHIDMIELLIKHGASVDYRSDSGATALLYAVENNHQAVVDVLLNHHADMSIPLLYRSNYHDQFNVTRGDNPLFAAIKLGRKEMVRTLLDKGALVNIQNGRGDTPLHIAVRNDRMEIAEMLIEKGAAVDGQTRWTDTALHLAARKSDAVMTKMLIEKGANINLRTFHAFTFDGYDTVGSVGETAFMIAIENNHREVVDVFLKHHQNNDVTLHGNNGNQLNIQEENESSDDIIKTEHHCNNKNNENLDTMNEAETAKRDELMKQLKVYLSSQVGRMKLGDANSKYGKLSAILNYIKENENLSLIELKNKIKNIREITKEHTDTGIIGFFKFTYFRNPTSYNAFKEKFNNNNELTHTEYNRQLKK